MATDLFFDVASVSSLNITKYDIWFRSPKHDIASIFSFVPPINSAMASPAIHEIAREPQSMERCCGILGLIHKGQVHREIIYAVSHVTAFHKPKGTQNKYHNIQVRCKDDKKLFTPELNSLVEDLLVERRGGVIFFPNFIARHQGHDTSYVEVNRPMWNSQPDQGRIRYGIALLIENLAKNKLYMSKSYIGDAVTYQSFTSPDCEDCGSGEDHDENNDICTVCAIGHHQACYGNFPRPLPHEPWYCEPCIQNGGKATKKLAKSKKTTPNPSSKQAEKAISNTPSRQFDRTLSKPERARSNTPSKQLEKARLNSPSDQVEKAKSNLTPKQFERTAAKPEKARLNTPSDQARSNPLANQAEKARSNIPPKQVGNTTPKPEKTILSPPSNQTDDARSNTHLKRRSAMSLSDMLNTDNSGPNTSSKRSSLSLGVTSSMDVSKRPRISHGNFPRTMDTGIPDLVGSKKRSRSSSHDGTFQPDVTDTSDSSTPGENTSETSSPGMSALPRTNCTDNPEPSPTDSIGRGSGAIAAGMKDLAVSQNEFSGIAGSAMSRGRLSRSFTVKLAVRLVEEPVIRLLAFPDNVHDFFDECAKAWPRKFAAGDQVRRILVRFAAIGGYLEISRPTAEDDFAEFLTLAEQLLDDALYIPVLVLAEGEVAHGL